MTAIVIYGTEPPNFSCFMHVEGQGKRDIEDDPQVCILGNWGDGRCLGRENNGFNFMHDG